VLVLSLLYYHSFIKASTKKYEQVTIRASYPHNFQEKGNTVTTYIYGDANGCCHDGTCGAGHAFDTGDFQYDANGQRTQKTAGSDVTNYFYSGLDLLYTEDGSGDIIEENILEDDGSMICSKRANGSHYWYRQDIRGSVTNIVDADDDIAKSYTYDAYGNTSSTGTFVNSFAYTGAVIDEETDLYYMNARYYDPATGRFISEDSYRGDGEVFWHLYAYCDGDPVNNTDPTGHAKYGAVLYDGKNFSNQAEDERKYLKKKYGLTDSYKFRISSAKDFKDAWNRLSSLYTAVSLIFHAAPHAFSCSDSSGDNIASYKSVYKTKAYTGRYKYSTASLNYKAGIKSLRLLMCNAGHQDHYDDNLANAFKGKISGDVWASDGSVSFYRFGTYSPRLASDQKHFYQYLTVSIGSSFLQRQPNGFYWYSSFKSPYPIVA